MHPHIVHIGHLYLPTFGVLAAIGVMGALALSQHTARLTGVDPERLWDAAIILVLAAFVFSRALLIASNWHTFAAFPVLLLAVPSLTVPGMLLAILATLAYLRRRRIALFPALDAWAPAATLVWAALALGHFFEGSDPGMHTVSIFGMASPGRSFGTHPVALYAAAVAMLLTLTLLRGLRIPHSKGRIAGFALLLSGVAQFLLSFFREPGVRWLGGLDQLQWTALGLMLAGGVLLPLTQKKPARL